MKDNTDDQTANPPPEWLESIVNAQRNGQRKELTWMNFKPEKMLL